MKNHASSHGLALLICTISAGVLIKIGRDYYPQAVMWLEEGVGQPIIRTFNIDYPPKVIATLALAVLLALIWGAAFALMHSDRNGR